MRPLILNEFNKQLQQAAKDSAQALAYPPITAVNIGWQEVAAAKVATSAVTAASADSVTGIVAIPGDDDVVRQLVIIGGELQLKELA